jgi:hypothetical protein
VEELGKIEDALDEVVNECVLTPGFSIDNIYLQDRFFLLMELRRITKGNAYTFQLLCPECGGQSMQTVNLSDLPVNPSPLGKPAAGLSVAQEDFAKNLQKKVKKGPAIEVERDTPKKEDEIVPEPAQPKMNRSTVILNDKIQVEMKMITRGIQKEAFKFVETLPDLSDIQKRIEAVTVMHAHCMTSVTVSGKRFDNLSFDDRLYMLDNITQTETDKIVKWFDDNDFGVDFNFTQKCPHCKAESRREVPMEDFFF